MRAGPTINFDVNASYGATEKHLDAVAKLCGHALNPSSVHCGGQRARALIEESRESVRRLVDAPTGSSVIFTSGATEANNLAIFGAASLKNQALSQAALVITSIEHPSVLACAEQLEKEGISVVRISPRQNGEFNPNDFVDAVGQETILLSLMLANNESGQILPLKEIVQAVKNRFPNLKIHCDAVQAAGKINFSMSELKIDMLSVSAHKLGGVTGVGALIVRDASSLGPRQHGGPQEGRLRAGTENVFGIVSLGLVCDEVLRTLDERISLMAEHRQIIEGALRCKGHEISINFANLNTLPNTLSVRVKDIRADDLVVALDLRGICVSSGAACASGKPQVSHVLTEMGLSPEEARETIRLSLGAANNREQVEKAANEIIATISEMRAVTRCSSTEPDTQTRDA